MSGFVKRNAPDEIEKDIGEQINEWTTERFNSQNLNSKNTDRFDKAIDDVSKAVSRYLFYY